MAIRQVFRFIVYGAAGLAMLVIAVAAVLAARLADGPVSLGFLLPTVELYLDRLSPPLRFRIDGALATWRGWDHGLALSLNGIQIGEPASQAPAFTVPGLDLMFSADALRHAVIVPATIEMTGATLEMVRSPNGIIGRRQGSDAPPAGEAMLATLFDELRAPPDPARPLSYLERVVVRDGAVGLTDAASGKSWRGRVHEVSLSRSGDGIAVAADATLDTGAGDVPLSLNGDIALPGDAIEARLAFAGLDGSRLAAAAPALAALALPLDGDIVVRASPAAVVERIGFDIRGGPGEVRISPEMAKAAGEPRLAQTVGIAAMAASGSLTLADLAVELKAFDLRFAPGTTIFVPELDHRFPLRSVTANGTFGNDRLVVEALALDLNGPTIAVTATAEHLTGGLAAEAKISVANLPMDGIGRYWPKTVAPGGLEWCAAHLSRGMVTMDADIALADQGHGIDIARFSAELTGEGARVDYLPDLPPVENARARGTLNLKELSLTILGGNAGGLVIRGGTVVIHKFDEASISISPAHSPMRSMRSAARRCNSPKGSALIRARSLGKWHCACNSAFRH